MPIDLVKGHSENKCIERQSQHSSDDGSCSVIIQFVDLLHTGERHTSLSTQNVSEPKTIGQTRIPNALLIPGVI